MAASATPFHIEEDQARRSVGEHVVEFGLRVPLLKVRETKTGIFSRMSGPSKSAEKSSPSGAKELLNSSMIKVFHAKPVSASVDVAHLAPESFEEVYQSEVQMGPSPTFATLLLLPLESRHGRVDGKVVPLRFEIWVGVKRANPDTRYISFTCTLSGLIEDLGGVSELSSWSSFAGQIDVEARVAHPDRLTSIIVPPSLPLDDVTQWRVAPKLGRDLMRGFVNSSVSRGFQTPTRDSPLDFIEFREEMAEMPLNLLLPSLFVDEAERNLEVLISKLPKQWSNDKEKVLKLLAQGSRGTYEMTPKDEEALRRYDKAAGDACKQAKERAMDMRRISAFYYEQWERMLTGKITPRVKTSVRISRVPLEVDTPLGSHSSSSVMPTMTEVRAQSDGGTEYILPLPGPEFSHGESMDSGNTYNNNNNNSGRPSLIKQDSVGSLASTASAAFLGGSSTPHGMGGSASPSADVDEEELSEERQWELARGQGGLQQVSFRPSTSRKDSQLRFLPINLHLQVLTVRDAKIDKRKEGAPVEAKGKKTMISKVRASIAQTTNFIRSGASEGKKTSSGLGALAEDEDSPPSQEAADLPVVPSVPNPEIFEAEGGVLASSGRRRGRQSIVGTIIGGPSGSTGESPKNGSSSDTPRTQRGPTLPSVSELDGGLPFWDDDPHILYETLSVGAPSAHGMKTSGLTLLREELGKLKHEAERLKDEPPSGVSLASRLEAYRKYHDTRLLFAERLDIVLCQAITSVVASILARIYIMASTGGTEDEDDVALEMIQHGLLIGWESLLSTHGSEINMLSDTKFAVRYLTDNVLVRLELLPDDTEVKATDVRLYRSNRACPAYTSPGGLDESTAIVVSIRLPDKVVDELPRPLRTYMEDSSLVQPGPDGVLDVELCKEKKVAPLSLTCVLFTQGINEMQSLANLWGSQGSWQEDINKESSELIYQFIGKRFGEESSTLNEQQEKTRKVTLMALAKLRHAMKNQANVEKNYEILTSSADLVRWLGGIRICSCKSAKDRTAMSLTLEEARLLYSLHHVAVSPMDLANVMREHGTRLVNVNKNTGTPKYAFNIAQRKLLPEQYRPPMNVIGGFFRGNVT